MCGNGFRGSLGLSCAIFKMASLILIASRQETFSYLAMFCKIYRYPKHRQTLSRGKLLLTSHYQTLTNQNSHVDQVLFMVNLFSIFGWVVHCFFPRTTSLTFTKNWLPGKLFGRLGRLLISSTACIYQTRSDLKMM